MFKIEINLIIDLRFFFWRNIVFVRWVIIGVVSCNKGWILYK